MNPFDSYSIKARLAPSLLVLLPLAAVVAAWVPSVVGASSLATLAVLTLGGAVILASQTRAAGVQLEKALVKEWGAMPTTILLRHSDGSLSAERKASYHAMLQARVPGIRIPDVASEASDPAAADRQYEVAIEWLREQTRGNPVVDEENASYGFFRNLCALRLYGVLASLIGIAGCGALPLIDAAHRRLDSPAAFAFAVSIACLLVMIFAPTRQNVRTAGFRYARALLRALHGTGRA